MFDFSLLTFSKFGQLGDGTNLDKNKPTLIDSFFTLQIAAGGHHSMILTNESKVFTFGSNDVRNPLKITKINSLVN